MIDRPRRVAPAGVRTAILLTLVAGAVGFVIAGARAQSVTTYPAVPPATSQPSVGDAHTLLGQRRDAYRRIEQIIESQAAQGAATPADLHEAKIDRLQAEIELAETYSAYAKIQGMLLDELRREEARIIAAAAAGRATEVEALRARINRIEQEIEIAMDAEEQEHGE